MYSMHGTPCVFGGPQCNSVSNHVGRFLCMFHVCKCAHVVSLMVRGHVLGYDSYMIACTVCMGHLVPLKALSVITCFKPCRPLLCIDYVIKFCHFSCFSSLIDGLYKK